MQCSMLFLFLFCCPQFQARKNGLQTRHKQPEIVLVIGAAEFHKMEARTEVTACPPSPLPPAVSRMTKRSSCRSGACAQRCNPGSPLQQSDPPSVYEVPPMEEPRGRHLLLQA